MVARDKPRKGLFGAGLELLDQSRLFGLERKRAGKIAHGEVRLQISVLPPYRNKCKLGTILIRPGPKK